MVLIGIGCAIKSRQPIQIFVDRAAQSNRHSLIINIIYIIILANEPIHLCVCVLCVFGLIK